MPETSNTYQQAAASIKADLDKFLSDKLLAQQNYDKEMGLNEGGVQYELEHLEEYNTFKNAMLHLRGILSGIEEGNITVGQPSLWADIVEVDKYFPLVRGKDQIFPPLDPKYNIRIEDLAEKLLSSGLAAEGQTFDTAKARIR